MELKKPGMVVVIERIRSGPCDVSLSCVWFALGRVCVIDRGPPGLSKRLP
jgi:hypothetical protein